MNGNNPLYSIVAEQVYLRFQYKDGKWYETIADNILVENIPGGKIIYSESKLGSGILSDNQAKFIEMVKSHKDFKPEIRSQNGIPPLYTQGQKFAIDQINFVRSNVPTQITPPKIDWTR